MLSKKNGVEVRLMPTLHLANILLVLVFNLFIYQTSENQKYYFYLNKKIGFYHFNDFYLAD